MSFRTHFHQWQKHADRSHKHHRDRYAQITVKRIFATRDGVWATVAAESLRNDLQAKFVRQPRQRPFALLTSKIRLLTWNGKIACCIRNEYWWIRRCKQHLLLRWLLTKNFYRWCRRLMLKFRKRRNYMRCKCTRWSRNNMTHRVWILVILDYEYLHKDLIWWTRLWRVTRACHHSCSVSRRTYNEALLPSEITFKSQGYIE